MSLEVSRYVIILPIFGRSGETLKGKRLLVNGLYGAVDVVDEKTASNLEKGRTDEIDGEEIKRVSKKAGAEIIDRPAELADDYATTAAVMKHAVQYLIDKGVDFDFVVLLQATNPLRPKKLLDDAIKIIEKGENDSLFTVNKSEKKLGKIIDGKFVPWNYKFGQRSQDLDPLYYENGLLYITSKELLLQEVIEGPKAYPMVVDHPYGEVDIDTVDDFHYAEFMLNQYRDE